MEAPSMTVLCPTTLQDDFNAIARSSYEMGGWDKTTWTFQLKSYLTTRAAGYAVCGKGVNDTRWGEWLWDLVWLNIDEDIQIHSVELVVESEWGNEEDVFDDFQKLIVARAATRLMIFEAKTVERRSALITRMKRQIALFRGSALGDRYLFVSYVRGSGPFSVDEYIHGAVEP